jgi:hypothetical protein
MSHVNRSENNLRKRSGFVQNQASNRGDAELGKFSEAENVRVEKAWPTPSYTFRRDVTFSALHASDSAGPNSTAPEGNNLWNLRGFSGMAGYVTFPDGTSPTVDLELWIFDETNSVYLLSEEAFAVGEKTLFRFPEATRSHKCFLRVAAHTGSPTSAIIRATGE